MNWQPIETAPKDRRILLYYPEPIFNGINMVFGRWDEDEFYKKPQPHWEHDKDRLSGKPAMRNSHPSHWADIEAPATGGK
jgi:hypothetical protein